MQVPAVFMRGGTSKGLFFRAHDLPPQHVRDALFLRAMGSPDSYGRQLDGLGGGLSSLSKVAIVQPSPDSKADLDYTFAQVAVDAESVDYSGSCGNLAAAVGPFAVAAGMIAASEGWTTVRIRNTNTGKLVRARFEVRNGAAVEVGDEAIAGVTQSGAPILLDFLRPEGSKTGLAFPSGARRQVLAVAGVGEVEVTLIDIANPMVIVPGARFGLRGDEPPDVIDAHAALGVQLEAVRQAAGAAMGLGGGDGRVPAGTPKIALVFPPTAYRALDGSIVPCEAQDLAVRMLSMGRAHRAVTLTGAIGLAAACRLTGAIPSNLCRSSPEPLRIAHPSGVLVADPTVVDGPDPVVNGVKVVRTARRLMQGHVFAPGVEAA